MNKQSDKDLLERLRTAEELKKRGYVRINCTACFGTGTSLPEQSFCICCDGKGYRWDAPLTR